MPSRDWKKKGCATSGGPETRRTQSSREVTSLRALETAVKYVDMLQIGARNMQNFELLKEVGRSHIPVLLKRGMAATIDEWLNAAEYIIAEGQSRCGSVRAGHPHL